MEDSTKKKWVVAGLMALGAAFATAIALKTKSYLEAPVAPAGMKNPDAARTIQIDSSDLKLVSRGKQVYAKQCAVCHGENLKGQPNWRDRLPNGRLPAPPHDASGHTWHHPDAVLFSITKNGLVSGVTAPQGYESDMPAFARSLSDEDIVAVLAFIKSTWPEKIVAAQKEVTEQYRKPQ